jgi:licheninase
MSSRIRARTWVFVVLVIVMVVQSLAIWSLIGVSAAPSETVTEDSPRPNCPLTAAAANNWGPPNRADDFDDPSTLRNWFVYDGPGHEGNGRRTPAAVSFANGEMTIIGDAQGNSAGMAWRPGQLHGRWEACVKTPPGAAAYHSVLLLWPDALDWPLGGEIDFMEILDPKRQITEGWLHFSSTNQRVGGTVEIDATQWHSWAVEWTPERIVYYVDGVPWWSTTDTAHFPPRSMQLCIQLDNFGGDVSPGGQEVVDWVRQYPLR